MWIVPILLLAAQGVTFQNSVPPAVQYPPVVMIPPPAPPGPRPVILHGPEARQPIQSLFSPDDYPSALHAKRTRGVVAMLLTIDASGHVLLCAMPHADVLAVATCKILSRRARFTPAMDSNGNPVTGSVHVQVDWDAVFRNVRVNRAN